MCGIAGIIDTRGVNPVHLQRMSEVLRHRGPDDEGFALINAQGVSAFYKGKDTIPAFSSLLSIEEAKPDVNTVGLMHKRLSILDLSPAGHQPMQYLGDKYQIVFNGEVYNYKELRTELQSRGYSFVSESDTEVIMAAYDKWGKDCVQKFVGMWAFALFDNAKQQVFISRDRFGIKPLYFYTAENNFVFASEIKALLALDHIKPEADMESVYEFICFGAASDPSANLFKNVHVLPPAHNLFVDARTAAYTEENYYDLGQAVAGYEFSNRNYLETFQSLLQDSISLHLRSDVPVGSALSGGLDSSTVVALAAGGMKNTAFHTFTAAYHEKYIDESDYAKKVVAGYSNIESHIIYPDSKGYWNDLDKLTWYQDLPINSTSMFAQWEVMKLAGQHQIKVLLDGQGSDEILGGYYNFGGIFLLELLKQGKLGKFFHEKNALKEKFSPAILNTMGRAAYYFLPSFLQRGVRANQRLGMNFIAPAYKDKIKSIKVPPRGGKTYRQQSLLSTQFGLQDLLRYEDRNSMAFSIESRVPFLDHRLVEFCIALPNAWKIKDGWTKYILRKTAEPLVVPEVAWRKFKMGFLTPQKAWKEQSKKELDQFVNDVRLPGFLDKNYLIGLNSANVSSSSHLSEFWKMISFLKWAEVFKVSF